MLGTLNTLKSVESTLLWNYEEVLKTLRAHKDTGVIQSYPFCSTFEKSRFVLIFVCVCADFLRNMSLSYSPTQMIHEDGGSRSKGSPAGKTLKNTSLRTYLKPTTRREKEQESDEDSRAQVQTNLNSKSLLTMALTIESRFMSFYDSNMSTFLEQRAIQRALKATSDSTDN